MFNHVVAAIILHLCSNRLIIMGTKTLKFLFHDGQTLLMRLLALVRKQYLGLSRSGTQKTLRHRILTLAIHCSWRVLNKLRFVWDIVRCFVICKFKLLFLRKRPFMAMLAARPF